MGLRSGSRLAAKEGRLKAYLPNAVGAVVAVVGCKVFVIATRRLCITASVAGKISAESLLYENRLRRFGRLADKLLASSSMTERRMICVLNPILALSLLCRIQLAKCPFWYAVRYRRPDR